MTHSSKIEKVKRLLQQNQVTNDTITMGGPYCIAEFIARRKIKLSKEEISEIFFTYKEKV
jgi:hypothetical protein